MKVLVTGGTGYLGRAIVLALTRAGHTAVVFARTASTSGLPGRLVDGDVRERAAIDRAADGVEAICHAAALVSIWRPRRQDFDDVNVGGLENAIAVCRARGVARLVYTSSFLALPPAGHDRPIEANDYQRTKVAGLRVARAAAGIGTPIVTLTPGVIYGPGSSTEGNLVGRMMNDHLNRRLPGVVGADRQWSFAHVDDIAAAHVAALTRGTAGHEYAIGGENAPQMRMFEVLRRLRGTPLPRQIPYAVATALGGIGEGLARLSGRPPLLTRGTVEIFRYDWPLDSRLAIEVLGYRVTPLEQGLPGVLPPGPGLSSSGPVP